MRKERKMAYPSRTANKEEYGRATSSWPYAPGTWSCTIPRPRLIRRHGYLRLLGPVISAGGTTRAAIRTSTTMWWRVPCLRPQQFAVQRAWKSTRRSIKPPKSSLFESTPAPFLPRPSTPIFHLSEPRIPTHVRFGTCLVAFAAGFSIYFFLDDPEIVGPPPKLPVLSPSQFVVTKLTSTEASGPDTKLVKIAAPPHLLPLTESNDASIWSVFIKDDDIQVERAYTPLHGVDSKGDMLFWIKKYPKGEVGRWIHSKNAGDKIEIRGPIKTWPWKDGLWDEVVMVSNITMVLLTMDSSQPYRFQVELGSRRLLSYSIRSYRNLGQRQIHALHSYTLPEFPASSLRPLFWNLW